MFTDCLSKTDDGVPEDSDEDVVYDAGNTDHEKAEMEKGWPEREEARRIVNEQMILQPVTPYQHGEAGDDVEDEDPDEIQVDEVSLHDDTFNIDLWQPVPDCTGLTTQLRATCALAIKNVKIGPMVG